MSRARAASRRRRIAWFGLVLAVLVVHAVLGWGVASSFGPWKGAARPRRIVVALTKRLAPAAPPAVAARPPAAPSQTPRPAHAAAPAAPSSAAQRARAEGDAAARRAADEAAAASHRALVDEALSLADRLEAAEAASAAEAHALKVAAAAPAASAASAAPQGRITVIAGSNVSTPLTLAPPPAFEWPPSTRLTYTLSGLYRNGPLYGRSSVEWRLEGSHYQVQFDIHVSPFFDQHMLSDGQVTATGLRPQHYDESFETPLGAPRVRRIEFSDDEVTLANGTRVRRLPQTQDGASQFVQFVWMLSTRPELLRPGVDIDLPLALNNNLRRWHYRIVGAERLTLPFGVVDTLHLKPILEGPRRPNEYPFELWMAPTLQYLPVRILVPIDERNFADLSLDALPLQADTAPARAAAARPDNR